MVYSEQNYESEQRRQELLKNIQPGFYKPKDPADDTIVYIFRKRGITMFPTFCFFNKTLWPNVWL